MRHYIARSSGGRMNDDDDNDSNEPSTMMLSTAAEYACNNHNINAYPAQQYQHLHCRSIRGGGGDDGRCRVNKGRVAPLRSATPTTTISDSNTE
jgi:hypothetical protein